MTLGLGPFGYLYVTGIIGIAILLVTVHWSELFAHQLPARVKAVSPLDGERHILTLVGTDGRPNPARYEVFADYPTALRRQRDLSARGQGCVVRHADSGEIRHDLDILETYRRMAF